MYPADLPLARLYPLQQVRLSLAWALIPAAQFAFLPH